jgi:hypothetical protein
MVPKLLEVLQDEILKSGHASAISVAATRPRRWPRACPNRPAGPSAASA